MTGGGRVVPRIVVGVDGSVASLRALRWAMGQAEATSGMVEAVAVWDVPSSYGFGPTVLEREDLAAAAEQWLAAAVNGVSSEYPAVAVQRQVLRGHPAAALLEQAKGADLLVVGSHGHGGFVGALVGSVSQQCVHHATCPVVVVRTDE